MSLPQEVSGFEYVSHLDLPDFGVTSYLYRHKVHNCPFLYLKTDDTHNFFSATFRTAPYDDYGRSHMLEHLVLDGTDKFPVRDLFSEMNKRSFSTFMNALTSNQFTSFPFSTINKQDYFNLLDVYLDACFHPKLSPISFMSECFHNEFEDNDPNKPLLNCGVVYNEMKGFFNTASSWTSYTIRKELLPDSYERFESGGLPECIAKSSIKDIVEHHNKYYHPSNALFFHYGNIPIQEVFSKVEDVISKFPSSEWKFNKQLFNQPRWTVPKRIEIDGPMDPMTNDPEKQYKVAVAYLNGNWDDPDGIQDIDFLFDLLTENDTSPMYKAVIKPGYAVQKFVTNAYNHCFNNYCVFGFERIEKGNVEKVIQLIQETLEHCYKEGFDKDRVEMMLHEREIQARKLSSNTGIDLFSLVIYGQCFVSNPNELLDTNRKIERIRRNISENPRYYQEMIKTAFLDNTHRLTVVVNPIEGFMERVTNKTTEALAEKKKNLTQEEINSIVENYNTLKEWQTKEQPVDKLPSIKRSDLTLESKYDELTSFQDNVAVLALPLNQMTYIDLDVFVDFNHPLIDYLPILRLVLSKVGAGDMDEEQLEIFQSLYTDGVSFAINGYPELDDSDKLKIRFNASVACLDRNIEQMMKVLKTIIFEPHLDNAKRVEILVKKHLVSSTKSINSRGHRFVQYLISSNLSNYSALREEFKGAKHLLFVKKLVEANDWKDVCDKLQIVYKECFLKGFAKGFVHTSSPDCSAIPQLKEIVSKLNDHPPVASSPIIDKNAFSNIKNVFANAETNTNFTVTSCKAVPYMDPRNPILQVLADVLENEFLNQMIRNEIGAYGAWAICESDSGTFSLISYRDPNVSAVLDAFSRSLDLCEKELTDEMVDRGVVYTFSSLDRPQSPQAKGFFAYQGKTKEIIQARRNIYYNINKQQILDGIKFLKEAQWNKGALSSKSIAPPPDGFEVIDFSI